MIVRMGKTVAVATNKEGIPDLTAGLDLQADLYTDNEIWITVRGGYTVYNESGKKIKPIIE
ncbi:hypothetical protein P5G65_15660 [Paenibacillus chondroitinus]|uniref:Uncharacterized protein n=1 Tax=Paenibacillus chondroitinus TaxID=59842 RepID=A0ABU6DC58_9BACL|nr:MULTISPECIES: hypothetical protein [Paenibacillus]MCY9656518.1 hypothetical protein [Paenibacillus anseongense]MEB4795342.1 hypothetical protein [Paenibacillus chondroitinus]